MTRCPSERRAGRCWSAYLPKVLRFCAGSTPTKTLHIPTADGQADAFAALPNAGGRRPGVLMYPDGFGIRPVLRQMACELAAERTLSDADAYLRFLTTQPEVSAGPVAVTGYCIGGLMAVRNAATHPNRVDAVARFHVPVGADGPDVLSKLTAQLHFGHAESDVTPGPSRSSTRP